MGDRINRLQRLLGDQQPRKVEKPEPNNTTPSNDGGLSAHQAREAAFAALPSADEYLAQTGGDKQYQPSTSAHLAATTPLQHLVSDEDTPPDSRMGEPSPVGISLCPFQAVAKFPYKFIPNDFRQPVATAFFDANKIWDREWDLYYVWSPHFSTAKAVTFVPLHQFQAVIDEINTTFPELKWVVTEEHRTEGLVIGFDDSNPDLRPRWLGHSNNRKQHEDWQAQALFSSPSESDMAPDDRSIEAFRAHMELAVEVAKTKSKAAKSRKREETVIKRQEMTKQVQRAQQYLGLAGKTASGMPNIAKLSFTPLDVSKPPPHPFDMDAIFISIDVEAWERNQNCITEVGVATLDTCDLRGKPPGRAGVEWHKAVRGRHFRILENKHRHNHEFVRGCEEDFEFGESEFIGEKSMGNVLTSCFHEPFSKPASTSEVSQTMESEHATKGTRNLILLGHDINQDISYLHRLGFSPLNRGNLLECMDTSIMYRSYMQEPNPRSLGGILLHFDITAWHLHNAGNDAVYTIYAMLAVCVAEAEGGDGAKKKRCDEAREQRAEAAVEAAKERVKEDAEGW